MTRTPSDIYPSLSYDDAPAAIEWLCRAFGFAKRFVAPGADGYVTHSELSLGTGVIMVSSAKPDQGRVSPRSLSGVNQAICVLVDDPDAHCARARAAGAEILEEPYDSFGFRGYGVADLEGHRWFFSDYRPGEHWGGAAEVTSPP